MACKLHAGLVLIVTTEQWLSPPAT